MNPVVRERIARLHRQFAGLRFSRMDQQPKGCARIAVLAPGAGSTFRHLVDKSRRGQLPAEIALLITTKAGAPVAQHAGPAGVEHLFLDGSELGPDVVDGAICRVERLLQSLREQ